MTFVQCMPGESEEALSAAVQRAYTWCFSEKLDEIEFGKLIAWKDKLFREVRFHGNAKERLMAADRVFHSLTNRATLQTGRLRGILFETPASSGDEIVARVRENGWERIVDPFVYETRT